MGRVLTNNSALAFAVQTGFDVLNPFVVGDWKQLEFNELPSIGPDISTVARTPISKERGARQGTISDLDAAVEFSTDVTFDLIRDFIEGFAYSIGVNVDVTKRPSGVTATEYTVVGNVTAKLQFDATASNEFATLVFGRGFTTAANNGLKPLSAASTATTTPVAGLVLEAAIPQTQNATVELAGVRLTGTGTNTWDFDAPVTGQATLTTTITNADFTTMGLSVGQFVHFGSGPAGSVINAFQNSAANDMFGYARIVSIAAKVLVFDKLDAALKFDDGTAPTTAIDMLFGFFVRNVATDDSAFNERIYIIEAASPNLFETDPPTPVTDPDGFEYMVNTYPNQFAWALPITDKSTATLSFVSTDSEVPVDNAARRTGALEAKNSVGTAAFNTSSNVTRLRVTDVDETGLTTDFKDLTITFNNNVSPEKVVGKLGARFINVGNLGVTIEGSILFTSPLVPARIRANTAVTFDSIMVNPDCGIAIDIPKITLGGGGRELPVNETVQLSLTADAFLDSTNSNIVFGISVFPNVPA